MQSVLVYTRILVVLISEPLPAMWDDGKYLLENLCVIIIRPSDFVAALGKSPPSSVCVCSGVRF